MKPREIILKTGTKIFLGKNSENNDELVKSFKGKENVIMHTIASGSPFCVIEKLNPTKEEIKEAGTYCAKYSQDWRDNKRDVKIHVFTGKDVKKPFFAKKGTWKIIGKAKTLNVKKQDVLKIERKKE